MDVAVRYAIMQSTVTDTANVPKFRCILWPANLNTELYHNHQRLWILQTPHPIQCAMAKKCAINEPPLIMFFMRSVNQFQMHRKNDNCCSDWDALTKSVLNLISISVQSSDYKKLLSLREEKKLLYSTLLKEWCPIYLKYLSLVVGMNKLQCGLQNTTWDW